MGLSSYFPLAILILSGPIEAPQLNAPASPCAVTLPNGKGIDGVQSSPDLYGNGVLAVYLWENGTVVFAPGGSGFVLSDGSLSMKFAWERGVRGRLRISGRRTDAPAPPLRAHIPSGYGDIGFQASAIIFPVPGCWEVTSTAKKSRSMAFEERSFCWISG